MKDHTLMPLYQALKDYSNSNPTVFDVPGHKMGQLKNVMFDDIGNTVLRMDVNSMQELDLLAYPETIIKEAQDLMADAYKVDHSYFLVNGTSVGVIAMLLATLKPNDKIIVPRNIHKSVVSGIILAGARPVYITPSIDKDYLISNNIAVDELKATLKEHADCKAVLFINPTYFGAIGQIEELIAISKEAGLIVLVDQAHGAHFPFLSSTKNHHAGIHGADLIAVSTHKTLGSLSQSSVLLHNEQRVKVKDVTRALNMLTTTSASYLLMASLDAMRHSIMQASQADLDEYVALVNQYKQKINALDKISVIDESNLNQQGIYAVDPMKLAIKVNELGLNGFEVYHMLKKEYNIQMELAETYMVLAIISFADTKDSLHRLYLALEDISKRFANKEAFKIDYELEYKHIQICTPQEAFYSEHESVKIADAINRTSANAIMIYPPGIPLVLPGEQITSHVISMYEFYLKQEAFTLSDNGSNYVEVIKEKL